MKLAETDPTVEVSTGPGVVRIVIHPARSWPLFLLQSAILAISFSIDERWGRLWYLIRVLLLFGLVANVLRFIFQFLGTELVEVDATKITLRKDILGWYRIREFEVHECRELEWTNGLKTKNRVFSSKSGGK